MTVKPRRECIKNKILFNYSDGECSSALDIEIIFRYIQWPWTSSSKSYDAKKWSHNSLMKSNLIIGDKFTQFR